jgi:large subunit ribosomal protein L21
MTSTTDNLRAVIATGGAQHLVAIGETLTLPTREEKPGEQVTFDEVLLLADKDVQIGKPTIAGAKVTGTIVSHGRTAKVRGVKFHNKVRYRRTFGHRQGWTKVKIEKIG